MPGVRFDEEPEWLEDFLPWHPDVQAFLKIKPISIELIIDYFAGFYMHCFN